MSNLFFKFFQIIVGFAGGIAVGAGYVAFLTMLKVIPRLLHMSEQQHLVARYVTPVIIGSLFGTFLSFTNLSISIPMVVLLFFGLLHGIFNGMLAAALAEVLNVFPILSRRIGLEKYLKSLMMALVFGKVFGSLFQWVFFVKY